VSELSEPKKERGESVVTTADSEAVPQTSESHPWRGFSLDFSAFLPSFLPPFLPSFLVFALDSISGR